MHETTITVTVDGESRIVTVDSRTTLLDALRDRLGVISRLKSREPHSVVVSAKTGEGIADVLRAVEADLPHPGVAIEALLPYERGDLLNRIHVSGEVESVEHTGDGSLVRGRVHEGLAGELEPYLVTFDRS